MKWIKQSLIPFEPKSRYFEGTAQTKECNEQPPVILMVSGGSDSIALLYWILENPVNLFDNPPNKNQFEYIDRSRIHVLHVHHHLRDESADKDAYFVERTVRSLGLPFHLVNIDCYANLETHGGNIEACARTLRYEAAYNLAYKLADEYGCPVTKTRILTAHTADDRAETLLMRILNGAGLSGLIGIREFSGLVVRPLLYKTKKELRNWLTERHIGWREDEMNFDTSYLRPYVRHEVIPKFIEKNPSFLETVSRTLDNLEIDDEMLDKISEDEWKKRARFEAQENVLVFNTTGEISHKSIAHRLACRAIEHMILPNERITTDAIEKLMSFFGWGESDAPKVGTKLELVGGLVCVREQNEVSLSIGEPSQYYKLREGSMPIPSVYDFGFGVLQATIEKVPDTMSINEFIKKRVENTPYTIAFDPDASMFAHEDTEIANLGLRLNVSAVDLSTKIELFGTQKGSKTLSNILAEHGVPTRIREVYPVLSARKSGDIVGVSGIRATKAASCLENHTQRVVFISLMVLDTNKRD